MTRFVPVFDRQGRFSPLKAAVLAGLLAPLAWLLLRAQVYGLGALPVKEALHVVGDWTLRFLVITLALTPAMRIFNYSKLALVRRMVGVGSFCYATLHFTLYIVQQKFDLVFVASEIALRIYLLIGFVALAGLSALAATSTDAAVRRLGQSWKKLHKLVYYIAPIALLHAFMQYKVDVSPAVLLAGFYVLLMAYRWMMRQRMAWTLYSLTLAAIFAFCATIAIEFAWYAIATGVNPWKVARANFTLGFGVRPAVYVLLSGVAVAVLHKAKPALANLRVLRSSETEQA